MSTWRGNEREVQPQDFLNLVYDTDSYVEESDEEPEFGDDEDEACGQFPEAPAYWPLTSPEFHDRSPLTFEDEEMPSTSQFRDRSPHRKTVSSESNPSSAGVLINVYDGQGMALDGGDDMAVGDGEYFVLDGGDVGVSENIFLAPDTHTLYVSPETRDKRERSERSGGRRAGRRGRSVRGQNARGCGYPAKNRKGKNRWEVGQPLTEIWTTDDDVPPELVSLAKEVLRKRQMRMHVAGWAERHDASESEDDDEFFDASNGADGLPRLEGQNLHFEWSPMESFQGQQEHFRPERTGSVNVVNSAYDAFRLYWGDDVLNLIVTQTNLYATKIQATAFQSDWYPTNIDEILVLFAFWMMLGIIKMPTVISCFSVDPLLKTEVFRRMFTRRRYELLNRALQFEDSDPAVHKSNRSNTGDGSFDRLHCLRKILTHLNTQFQENYILDQNICIDESVTLWKGRLSFKQCNKNKASKIGIKTFELCESATGYIWSFIVYSGKQSATDSEDTPGCIFKSTAIVKKLIGPLLNKGYRLFMDSWYNSPSLARFLKANGTDCVGTLRPTRKDVPLIINKAPLKRGELIARHSGDVSILSWQDKKRVTMISTCHGSATALPTVSSRPSKSHTVPFKPQMVLDYNKFMGGVDIKDQMLEPYLLERKRGAKWYMKLFKRLLNVSILNSRTLLQSSTQKHHDHFVFRLQLVDSILTNHLSQCPVSRSHSASISRGAHQQPGRLVMSAHWPVLLERPATSEVRNRRFIKRCVVCLREGRKDQRTAYGCETCCVPLCVVNCFKLFHTIP